MPSHRGISVTLRCVWLTFSLVSATRYNLFQDSTAQRHRNKNWCAHVVHRNVSCAVLGSTESFVEPELQPCPHYQPDCMQQVMYRTRFRPTYKIAYKTVTELEWRCCPAYQGPNCQQLKNVPLRHSEREQRPDFHPSPGLAEHTQRPDLREVAFPGQQFQGGNRVQQLENDVQRLSQTVLDLQTAMTGMNENLRLSIQEDTSKMLATLLNDLHTPNTALGGVTESIQLPVSELKEMGEVRGKVDDVADTLRTKSELLEQLQSIVSRHDGQLRLLMEAAHRPVVSTSPPGPTPIQTSTNVLQAYIDSKIKNLREELMEGIEIKMADMKNSCEYKIMSVQEQCEEQEASYLSLMELLDSKEAELRKEIHDLQRSSGDQKTIEKAGPDKESPSVKDLEKEVQRIGDAYQALNARVDGEIQHLSTVPMEDVLSARLEDLEARINITEKNAEEHCFYIEEKLSRTILEEVAELRKLLTERLGAPLSNNDSFPGMYNEKSEGVQTQLHSSNLVSEMENKMIALEKLCMTQCKPSTEVMGDLLLWKNHLDAIRSDVNQHSMRLVDLAHNQLLTDNRNDRSIVDLQNGFSSLKDEVVVLGDTVTGLDGTLLSYSHDLQDLNSTCDQARRAHDREVQQMLEMLDSRLSQLITNDSQVEELKDRLEQLTNHFAAELRRCKDSTEGVKKEVSGVDNRVTNVEAVCGKLDGISGTLQRIKEGLNKHVTSLWTCVHQMNATLRTHSGDISGLKGSLLNIQDKLSGVAQGFQDLGVSKSGIPLRKSSGEKARPPSRPSVSQQPQTPPVSPPVFSANPQQPVVETGEAGPPGTMQRMKSKLPQSNGSMTPITGFAGAPGYPPISPVSFRPNIVPDIHQKATLDKLLLTPGNNEGAESTAFSAGLSVSYPGRTGVIRFDKVLVNDGGHYSPHTGIFTSPRDGRYLLSAVLTAERGEQLQAVLSVSNRSIHRLGSRQDPRLLTQQRRECACDSSASFSLILTLKRGDRVAVVLTGGKLLASDSSTTLCTFSGLFLYPAPPSR